MSTFPARLFGAHLPGSGIAVNGEWLKAGGLRVIAPERELVATDLILTSSGFNSEQIKITWQDDTGDYALFIDNVTALTCCLAEAPPCYAQQLLSVHRKKITIDRHFRLGWTLLAALILIPFFLLCLSYLKRDSLTEWLVQRIPVQQEVQVGEAVLAHSRLTMQLIENGPAIDALHHIGTMLTIGSPHHYRWFVVNQNEINAFAAPGGIVFVNTGLLRAVSTPEELAGVLAHEIAHAELRHSLKVITKTLGLHTLTLLVIGDYDGSALAEGMLNLAELRFSRDAEREADHEGLRRLVAARIDPQGMVRFFEALEKRQKLIHPEILSTHPSNKERVAALKREISLLAQNWQPLAIDLAAIHSELPQP